MLAAPSESGLSLLPYRFTGDLRRLPSDLRICKSDLRRIGAIGLSIVCLNVAFAQKRAAHVSRGGGASSSANNAGLAFSLHTAAALPHKMQSATPFHQFGDALRFQ
jgi:hypothetical protein